jgi:transcriptional regulator with XRE-family HTH domain
MSGRPAWPGNATGIADPTTSGRIGAGEIGSAGIAASVPGARVTPERQLPGPSASGAPTVLRVLLGTQLRRLRESRGISAASAAYAIRGSESKISRIELGRSAVRELDVADLLDLYQITDSALREQLLTLASQASRPGWWHRYQDLLPSWFHYFLGLEESAEVIRSFDAQFVPGLLQTAEYTTAIMQLGGYRAEEVDRLVYLRRERQRRFQSAGLRLWAVIDEVALRREIGGAGLMRDQLQFLLGAMQRPEVTIQVTPFPSAASCLAPGSFSIVRLAAPELPDVVYVEQLTSAVYLDKRADVDRYVAAMDGISVASTTPEQTTALILALLAELEEGA